MVNLSKAYNDLAKTKTLINRLQRERAAKYIEMAAPEVLSNPRTADREITAVANLMQSGTDEQGIIDYLDYLTQKTNPEVARMKEQQMRTNIRKEARAYGNL